MEFQTVLENRRSVRSYDASKTVTTEQIKKIIEAGILAPSRKNSGTACFFCLLFGKPSDIRPANSYSNCQASGFSIHWQTFLPAS